MFVLSITMPFFLCIINQDWKEILLLGKFFKTEKM